MRVLRAYFATAILALAFVAQGQMPAFAQDDPPEETDDQIDDKVGYRNPIRPRDENLAYFTLDGLFEALEEGESLIISRHQNQIVIRKSGGGTNPYPAISDAIRSDR